MPIRRVIALLALLALTGCASHEHVCWVAPPPQNAGLLFDRTADYPAAPDLLIVRDWPSSDSYQQQSEFLVYRERLNDQQGAWTSFPSLTIRRFDMVRVGQVVR